MTKKNEFMYGLYPSFGGKLSKIYWWLFRNCAIVRWMNRVEVDCLSFPIHRIMELEGLGSQMAYNLGTPGKEQKISILGFNPERNLQFFAKYSEKPDAIALTRNEIRVYRILESTGLTPKLYDCREGDGFVWMKTECITGSHLKSMTLTKEIADLAVALSNFHIDSEKNAEESSELKSCLSHGDFCPWNMLVNNGKIQLIDWEMAGERPLGYDIFKYVWQISRLFTPDKTLDVVIDENKTVIDYYFQQIGVTDWSGYLATFTTTT